MQEDFISSTLNWIILSHKSVRTTVRNSLRPRANEHILAASESQCLCTQSLCGHKLVAELRLSRSIDCLPIWWKRASCHRGKLLKAERRLRTSYCHKHTGCFHSLFVLHCYVIFLNHWKNNFHLLLTWLNRQDLTQLCVNSADLTDTLALFLPARDWLQCEAVTRCVAFDFIMSMFVFSFSLFLSHLRGTWVISPFKRILMVG